MEPGHVDEMGDVLLLTTDQVAKLLQIHVETVRELAYMGQLPSRRIGRFYRFSPEDVEAYIESIKTPKRAAIRGWNL